MRALAKAALAPALVVVIASLVLASREAQAYPAFQFSSGTNRCGQCHVSPAGGGMLTAWGRSEAGDTISRGGNGAFLHGLWEPPSWLGIGGDLRLVSMVNATGGPESPELVSFPMQADLYLRAVFGDISLNVTLGDRGIVRPEDESVSGRLSSSLDRFISREHYVMWRPNSLGWYARVGRFFAPYGLRMVEHIFYIRRYTGNNLYEETYNVSGGYVAEDWEVHATAFMPVPEGFPDEFQAVGYREAGGAVLAEMRFADKLALALQTRIGIAPNDEARYEGGAYGKLWVEPAKMLLMGEADVIRQQIAGTGTGQTQFIGYFGPTFFPTRGLMTTLAYERYQEDLAVSKTSHDALDIEINFFPWAHFELVGLGRFQWTPGAPAQLGMLQLHYYL
jgi:hypothetical protein